jgi:membrane protease YdiL (CAAX protease family)
MRRFSLDEIFQGWPQSVELMIVIAAFTFSFFFYYFVMCSAWIELKVRGNAESDRGQAKWIVFQRLWGGGIMALFAWVSPFFFGKSPGDLGMVPGFSKDSILISLGLTVVVVIINLLRAGSPSNLVHYPQIRSKEWDLWLFTQSSLSWVAYLFGYELMFRGLLLFGCVETIGIWPAIAVNASLYAFAHLFKGPGETFGAILFGIILCIITLYTGDFLVAFWVHCALALSNQTIALMAHPDMHWVQKRTQ